MTILKYCPDYPEKAFIDLPAARRWVKDFVKWYNFEHLHGSIKFVTPEQRHNGEDIDILKEREKVYLIARANNPERWSGDIRNWEPITEVFLNPEKKKNKAA